MAFEEYAKGTHSYISLAQFLADLSVVSRNGTPLAKFPIKRILTNRAYLGFIKHKGEWFDGKFEPILSPGLFEVVQKVLKAKERPRGAILSNEEVSICGGILTFARTFFESPPAR